MREFDNEVRLDGWLIDQSQLFLALSDATIRGDGQRAEAGQKRAPMLSDLAAGLDQFTCETLECDFLDCVLFQKSIARTQRLSVTLEQAEIRGLRLSQEQIKEPAPPARWSFDQLQIFGAKSNRPQNAQIIR